MENFKKKIETPKKATKTSKKSISSKDTEKMRAAIAKRPLSDLRESLYTDDCLSRL